MRAIVRNKIAVFNPQGFVDGVNAPALITGNDIAALNHNDISMVLISLGKVVFFNKNGLDFFVSILVDFKKKKNVYIGFCDVDKKKYDALIKFYKDDIDFCIFKTMNVAMLFAPSNGEKSDENVLIWSDDESQRNSIAIELFNRGFNTIVAKNRVEFEEKRLNKEDYKEIVDQTYLGDFANGISSKVRENAVIYTLKGFVDADISATFDLKYHKNCLSVGFTVFIFEASKVVSMNIHGVNFFSRLSTSAAEYGATICIIGLSFKNTTKRFKEELEDAGILFFETIDDLLDNKELMAELIPDEATNKTKKVLNKTLISEMPKFVNATVETLEMMTGTTANKHFAKVTTLDVDKAEEKIASSIGFYGDLEGVIILIFSKKIAQKACSLLLGEETNDDMLVLDTLSEFVNIIGGKVKTMLSEENYLIETTLPRTFKDVSKMLESAKGQKGAQVDLDFDNRHFSFFLTR